MPDDIDIPIETAKLASTVPEGCPATLCAVVSALPNACILLNSEGEVALQNKAARVLTSPIEQGQHLSLILRSPDVLEAFGRAVAENEAQSLNYFERVPVNRWLEAHVAPIGSDVFDDVSTACNDRPTDVARGETWYLLLLTDLTQQQRLEQMRADFVSNASHELRTPLASLLGFIETLQGPARDDPDATQKFLEIMREQASRMARLITDLMSLSKIEQNAHIRPDTVVDAGTIVRHVVDSLSILASKKSVALHVDLENEQDLQVLGDRDELIQVTQNLIENAIKYGASGERVDVKVARVLPKWQTQRHWIEISVKDFGPGIASEHVPRLTERFYRVDIAQSRETGGTGLGLAIAKHILNRHRGKLFVESEIGEGAIFTVMLEAAD